MNSQDSSQKELSEGNTSNKVQTVQKAVSEANSQENSNKNKSQYQFESGSSITSQKNIIKSQYDADKQNSMSQTSRQQQEKVTQDDINQLKTIYTLMRDFKVDKQNKITLVNPNRNVLIQLELLWKRRIIKNTNFVLNLYLQKISETQKPKIIQFLKIYASINLFINEQKIQNKQSVHFMEGNAYYEGIQSQRMMITKTNGDIIDFYDGKVKDKVQHGEGQLVHQQNTKVLWQYFGQFVQGKRQGLGKQINSKGITYQGQFKNDFKHGKGSQITQKKRKNPQAGQQPYLIKNTYEGFFQHGLRHGEGTQITAHGQYVGEWFEGMKQGKGKMTYKNGHSYEGDWANNSFNGEGVYIELIKEDKFNKYEGQFKEGYYHGKGIMQYANGDKYDGQWAYGKKQGTGMYQWADGDYYDGQWQKDSAEGTGAACFGGVFYDGQFHLGQKHGLGQQSDADGNTTKAIWQNNQILKKLQINGQIVEQQEEQS